jgi:mRNA interferase MazF
MVCIQPSSENRLNKISGVDTFQVRSVSENRLLKKLGQVDNDTMQQISEALALVLAI